MNNNLITKITQIIHRENGSEVKIVAEEMVGSGLNKSIGVYVLRRESSDNSWVLLKDRPHTNWRSMSIADYLEYGRSELLQYISPSEILKCISMVGKPITQ